MNFHIFTFIEYIYYRAVFSSGTVNYTVQDGLRFYSDCGRTPQMGPIIFFSSRVPWSECVKLFAMGGFRGGGGARGPRSPLFPVFLKSS